MTGFRDHPRRPARLTEEAAANLKKAELFVVHAPQDPGRRGRNLGAWRARRYLSDVIGDIAAAMRWVVSQGVDRVVISADHGHMMLPEIRRAMWSRRLRAAGGSSAGVFAGSGLSGSAGARIT